jgi:hypothetical protein
LTGGGAMVCSTEMVMASLDSYPLDAFYDPLTGGYEAAVVRQA